MQLYSTYNHSVNNTIMVMLFLFLCQYSNSRADTNRENIQDFEVESEQVRQPNILSIGL